MLFADRIKETTTTTGTGDLTLAGAVTQFQTFTSRFSTNVRFYYAIVGRSGSEWEVGRGYLSGATTLVRELVLQSSNSDAAVNLSAGTKEVFCTLPARVAGQRDPSLAFFFLQDFSHDSITWISSTAGGATAAINQGLAGYQGILRQGVTNAATPDRTAIAPYLGGAPFYQQLQVGSGPELIWECCVRTPTGQDGSHQWSDRFGTGDSNTGDATNGIYFESDRAVNGDNNARLCAASGGTRTKTTMGVAPTANAFDRWTWVANAAWNSIQGYKNGSPQGSAVTTNIPNTNVGIYWFQLIKTLGNAVRSVDRDYAAAEQFFTTPR